MKTSVEHNHLVCTTPIADSVTRSFCFLRGVSATRHERVRDGRTTYAFEHPGDAEAIRKAIMAAVAPHASRADLETAILFTEYQ